MSSDSGTSTLEQAREHARRQAGTDAPTAPTIPATAATDLPPGVRAQEVLWDEVIGAGGYASRFLPRHATVRLSDLEGDACVQLLAYSAANPTERLNVADTVKVQWQAYLGAGTLLLSGMGRVLLTIVDDSSERHDALCGGGSRRGYAARYGDGAVWGPSPNPRDLLALAAAKHGLERRDIPPWVNLFKSVRIDEKGGLTFDGSPAPGRHVELRAEVDLLLILADTPHPLDPRPDYTATPVRITAWMTGEPSTEPVRTTTPERARAFLNTDELLRGDGR